jgi:CRP-like cAMP-binding protein
MITAYDLLSAHPFLDGIPPRYLDRLASWSHRTPIHAGARIFQEGARADRFWLIREGYVNLDSHVPGRGTVVVETIGPGQVLGWSWLFPPYRWHFGAVAAEPVLAIALDGEGVRGFCETEPAFGYELTKRFVAVVVERMQATRMRLLDLEPEPA